MGAQTEHGRIIAEAAKAALGPIGCRRVGRSRLWIADQRFWVVVVEFQPSGWSKGSYLNVGAMWLWSTTPGWAFHYGHRVEEFRPFETVEQFAVEAAFLAGRAAEEVARLRLMFPTIRDIADRLDPTSGAQGWRLYHAAVATALAGNTDRARDLFRVLGEEPLLYDWQRVRHQIVEALVALVDDPAAFRDAVTDMIALKREAQRLPPDPECLHVGS